MDDTSCRDVIVHRNIEKQHIVLPWR
ncbi:hypothetical protein CTRU02_215566 [Colletotrichum truncatum]|uniref:Uncharacterized protein n=1 Tax=Colletotrichum truncatum TaxID=5467 RepID=A0ACC3YC39_COLTU